MSLTGIATDWGQTLLQQPTLSVPDVRSWRANVRYAGHALYVLLAHTRRPLGSTRNSFGDDYPMVTALYESYQAQQQQQQVFAQLRGDGVMNAADELPVHH